MITDYKWVPVHTLSGKLIALDLIQCKAQQQQDSETRLLDQLLTIEHYADYFQQHGLLCCVTINFQLARVVTESVFIRQILGQLPFVRFKLTEDFPNLHDGLNNPLLRALVEQLNILWLDDLGAGDANLHALQSKMFEAVKLDRQFFQDNVAKPWFNILIANIRRYTNLVIVAGVEGNVQFDKLTGTKVWGVQGYYLPDIEMKALNGTSL